MVYCSCALPIKMTRTLPSKIWKCTQCELPVDPASKMIDKHIDPVKLISPTKNEIAISNKINEILSLLRSNGDLL